MIVGETSNYLLLHQQAAQYTFNRATYQHYAEQQLVTNDYDLCMSIVVCKNVCMCWNTQIAGNVVRGHGRQVKTTTGLLLNSLVFVCSG